jgi:NAD(P)-dependent dehydrogenase (short-subunit alcohol dehydrogenase family)
LSGKTALISGAASGIGRATALLFAREGARVAATDASEAGCRSVAEEILRAGGQALWQKLDVTREAEWESAVARVDEAWGALNVFVASAGISLARPVAEMELADWQRVMAINLDGVFLGTKHAARAMRRGGGGSVVLVSSASGIKAGPGASAYGTSKAAVRQFAKAAALECGADGIRVNTVLPGGVKTPMWRAMEFWQDLLREHGTEEKVWEALGAGTPLKRFAEPEEIAQAILYLASDAAKFVTGAELVIDGGWTLL